MLPPLLKNLKNTHSFSQLESAPNKLGKSRNMEEDDPDFNPYGAPAHGKSMVVNQSGDVRLLGRSLGERNPENLVRSQMITKVKALGLGGSRS